MKNVLGAIAITAAALATTAAFAESVVDDKRARLAALWGQDKTVTDSRTVASVGGFTGITSVLRFDAIGGQWAGNDSAGRVHPTAGRVHPPAGR